MIKLRMSIKINQSKFYLIIIIIIKLPKYKISELPL